MKVYRKCNRERQVKKMDEKFCPLRETYNCDDQCGFYDEEYERCAILSIAKGLNKLSECVNDNRHDDKVLSVDTGN